MIIDIETLGLTPIEEKIICIGIKDIEEDRINVLYGDDERLILSLFWSNMIGVDKIVTYNGNNFDIPFIIMRSIINGVKITVDIKDKLLDLRNICNSFSISYEKYTKGKLSNWAKILNFTTKTENGEYMKDFYNSKEWNKIIEHCKEDISVTQLLYDRLVDVGLI